MAWSSSPTRLSLSTRGASRLPIPMLRFIRGSLAYSEYM